MPLLLMCEIFGHFVNTSTPDDKYSNNNNEVLIDLIQIQLFQKQVTSP